MPDLSKMLGDVYDAPAPPGPDERPVPHEHRTGPEWADDEHLDRAFAGWTPGPGADAPARERSLFAGAAPEPLADDLAAALSEAVLAEQSAEPANTPEYDEQPGLTPVDVAPAMTATAFGGLATDAPPRPATPVPVPVADEPSVDTEVPAVGDTIDDTAVDDTAVEIEPEQMFRTSGAWQRADDDILPGSGGGKAKSFSLSLRRR